MAKLYVVFVGLVGLAEVDKFGVALVRKADGDVVKYDYKIPRHIPSVRYRDGNGNLINVLLSGDVRFIGNPEQRIVIQRRDQFFDFADLLRVSGRTTVTKPGCLAAKADPQCLSLLAGRVMDLCGDIYPVQIVRENGKLRIKGEPKFKVLKRYDPKYKRERAYTDDLAANGFLLEAEVDANDVELLIGETPYVLGKANEEDLGRIEKATEDAFVVWIENLPEDDHQHDPNPDDPIPDMHFWLFYDLLVDDREEDRWVPVVKLPQPPVIPGSQCITPIMP